MLGQLFYKITADTNPLNSALGKARGQMQQADKTMNTASKSISNASKSMGGGVAQGVAPLQQGLSAINPAAGAAAGGMKTAALAAKAMYVAMGPVGIIIAAIGVAIAALTAYFKGSVDGQQKFANMMAYIGGITGGIQDLFIRLGRAMVAAFQNPQDTVKKLWEVIKQNVVNRFKGLVGMITNGWNVIRSGAMGVAAAIAGIFSKEKREEAKQHFADMKDGMIEFGKAAVMANTGLEVDDFIKAGKAVAGAAKEIGERAKANMEIQRRDNQLKMDQIDATRDIARLEAEISKARMIANDDQRELTEQIQAQERAMELVAQKFKEQERLAREELEIQQARMALGENKEEDLEKEAELQAALIKLEQSRDNEMRSLLRRHGTLMNAQEAEAKAKEKAIEDEKKARSEVLEEIRKAGLTEVETLQETLDEKLARHEWSEQERLKITEHYEGLITQAQKDAEDERNADRLKVLERIREDNMSRLELMREQMEKELELYGLSEEEKAEVRKHWLDKMAEYEHEHITEVQEMWKGVSEVLANSMAQAADALGASLAGAETDFRSLATAALDSIGQIIQGLLAQAIAGMIAREASKGLVVGLAAAAVGVGAIKAMFAKDVPAFDKGGIVSGPTLGLMGEYPGAKINPEVIAPLSDLTALIQNAMMDVGGSMPGYNIDIPNASKVASVARTPKDPAHPQEFKARIVDGGRDLYVIMNESLRQHESRF